MIYIAEMCQNHNGNFSILSDMVSAAAKAGATHCKIQGLYSAELTNRPQFNNEDLSKENQVAFRPYEIEKVRLSALDLTEEQEIEFIKICEANQVIPMISVFTHEGARRAKRNGFKSIKVASYDCASFPLIENILEFASEIVISTGATTEGEIVNTKKLLKNSKIPLENQWFLHCISEYPTKFSRLNLNRIISLKRLHPNIGFSDHTTSMLVGNLNRQIAAKIAVTLGAGCIEQHFTILKPSETKDGPISVDSAQVLQLIEFSKLSAIEQEIWLKQNLQSFNECLGDGEIDPSVEEWKNRKYYRGRVASWSGNTQIFSWNVCPS